MQPSVVIVDTNILVAGLLTANTSSPPAQILDAMLRGGLTYLLSAELLREYTAVLQRPKIAQRHALVEGEMDVLLTELVANAIWREPDAAVPAPDPGDAHLWALLASYPDCRLVTGDQLLLDNPPQNGSVISARSYVDLFMQPGNSAPG